MSFNKDACRGVFIAIGGPSGAGKSTIINALQSYFGTRAYGSLTYTTRPPRKDEVDGIHYHFVRASEMVNYQKDSRYTNFVSARGNWYWVDSVELINTSRKNINGIYLTAITQVKEFIERRRIFPNLRWIWLTAQSNELYSRLEEREDGYIDKSRAHNELLERQDRSELVSLEINTDEIKLEAVLNQIVCFIKKLTEEDHESDSNHMQ